MNVLSSEDGENSLSDNELSDSNMCGYTCEPEYLKEELSKLQIPLKNSNDESEEEADSSRMENLQSK